MADFLMSYQQFTGRPLAEAYREFVRVWQAKHPEAAVPCLTVVRNAAKKLPKFVLERGRLTGARIKALTASEIGVCLRIMMFGWGTATV